ncbi:hypothetical protein HDV02_002822 [Globomyces sp. JEL0801]|nr:hypothetical protein HDV02_002822 [Globomyces sp. JEL0801]
MKEFTFVKYFVVSRATASSVTQTIPTFSMILTFMVYAQMGNEMRADIILPSLALFYSLRVTDAWLALGRIGDLLLSEELSTVLSHDEKDQNNNVALHIDNGCFEWETTDDSTNTFKLSNINVSIPKGSLTAIVGTIGSGKSSFLNALVGDMNCKSGTVKLNGTISYCKQQAWIQNSTLRDNILFGNPYDEAKYQSVLNDCALARDLSILPAGDKTEIGENGINLSGGQKQRISIARAVYAETDIVLLDDPLSAVDSHVGRYLFEQCIQTKLAGTTRILVTHQLHFVSQVDSIILMDNGEMVAQGSYEELMESSKLFHDLMTKYSTEKDEEEVEDNAAVIKDPIAAEKSKNEIQVNDTAPNGKLMAKEDQAKGVVSTSVLKDYLMLAGGLKTVVVCFFFAGMTHFARIYTDQWLTYWLTYKFDLSQSEYINIYVLLGVAQLVFGTIYSIYVVLCSAFASKSLHNNAIFKVFRSPLSFFDSTPLGRITSRFSRDVDTLDTLLPDSIRSLFWTSTLCLTNMILISFLIPWFAIAMVLVLICYYILQQYYMSTSRELKRIDSVARSPLLAQVSETLGGLSTIRAYKAEDRFIERNTMLLDKNNQAIYLGFMIQRWIQLRLQCLNSVLLLVATILAILLRDTLNPGITGVIIAYTLQITAVFTWTFKQLADTENYMNSSERLTYYMRDLASEKPSIIDSARPAKSWPHEGLIEAENMVMRYTPSSPIILNDLSFKIEPGHKIGAGKSTIFTSILRLVELESGKLTIDGVDISKIGLEDLRSRIAVIPQEPLLFSGTIRSNLDPFTDYSDEQLWDVLERSNLSSAVKSNASGLESPVTEGGENWSTGQRQLICLARAMLKKSKIIMLDEATASVDFETDEYIQKAIRKDFSDVTIAHRLNTIADYDKVMVLSFGKLVEYDSPHVLLSNPTSEFSKMVAETGKANAELIRVAAKHIEMIYNKR